MPKEQVTDPMLRFFAKLNECKALIAEFPDEFAEAEFVKLTEIVKDF